MGLGTHAFMQGFVFPGLEQVRNGVIRIPVPPGGNDGKRLFGILLIALFHHVQHLGITGAGQQLVEHFDVFLRHVFLILEQFGGKRLALGWRSFVNQVARRTESGGNQIRGSILLLEDLHHVVKVVQLHGKTHVLEHHGLLVLDLLILAFADGSVQVFQHVAHGGAGRLGQKGHHHGIFLLTVPADIFFHVFHHLAGNVVIHLGHDGNQVGGAGPVFPVALDSPHIGEQQSGILRVGNDFHIRDTAEILGVKQTAAAQFPAFHDQRIQAGVLTFHLFFLAVGAPCINPYAGSDDNQSAYPINNTPQQGFGFIHGSGHIPGGFRSGGRLNTAVARRRSASGRGNSRGSHRLGNRSGSHGRSWCCPHGGF